MIVNKKRQAIFDKSGGKCWYCGCDLTGTRWQADHYYPVIRVDGKMLYPELDTIDNLVPSCAPCNNFKHSFSPEGYRSIVRDQFENTLKYSTGLRQLNRFGLVDISSKPVVFWFEKQNIKMPDELKLCGISKEAKDVKWIKDNSEPRYFCAEFEWGMVTLRHMGSYWLAISVKDWDTSVRIEIPNGRFAKLQAADWALRLFKGDCND